MQQQTLEQLSRQYPFAAYGAWWNLGDEWSRFMSAAIVSEWSKLSAGRCLDAVNDDVNHYIKTIYKRDARPHLVDHFIAASFPSPLQSGEFDALSYGFYKSAFAIIEQAQTHDGSERPLQEARRRFTRNTGSAFFNQLHAYLGLKVPLQLANEHDFAQLSDCLRQLGAFVRDQGYLRDHFSFTFEIDLQHAGRTIRQSAATFLSNVNQGGLAHAVYEMGFPVVLPSAVYLYHGMGEAQHHSSRMIEELFALTGYQASETDDFVPDGYPAERVVELWEIRKA